MTNLVEENETFQKTLVSDRIIYDVPFPSTRFQGSKRRVIKWIKKQAMNFEFNSVLDCFGGTGIVSHLFKRLEKQVTYNDYLRSNVVMAKALIENRDVTISTKKIADLFHQTNPPYDDFVQRTFQDIYYTDAENKQIDIVTQNIHLIENEYERGLAFFALFQACLIKRPYNLFHRKNLYMRTSDVERSFGNKTTWERPFDELMIQFANEANKAVFDNGKDNTVLNRDALSITQQDYDLIYVDTPYISPKGVGVDYHHFYHFLEGLVQYDVWKEQVDFKSKHRRLRSIDNPWHDKDRIYEAFNMLFEEFRNSIIMVSYRSPGIPSIDELEEILLKYNKDVQIFEKKHQYVLSKRRRSHEVLLIAI